MTGSAMIDVAVFTLSPDPLFNELRKPDLILLW